MKQWRRKIFKKISYTLLLPISKWYASGERKTVVEGISIKVKSGVFHPALFFSTKYLLSWLKKQQLENLSVVELGAGSGLLSIYAAKQNAIVTASDISENACSNVKENAKKDNVKMEIIQSDLFTDIPWQQFDLILINPPYYPKNPVAENEYAWFCGEHFEYFEKLFFQIKRFMANESKAIMVLSEDCNIEVIESLAVKNNFKWQLIEQKKIWFEENYLFEITL
jgi:release factor glutamine methyltransferase